MKLSCLVLGVALCLVTTAATTETVGIKLTKESFALSYSGKSYSPYAQRDFPSRPLFGDQHVHTLFSMDASLYSSKLGLEERWRFARGEEVTSSTGIPAKLSRPYDWMVISDHSDQMGFAQALKPSAPEVMKSEQGKKWAHRHEQRRPSCRG